MSHAVSRAAFAWAAFAALLFTSCDTPTLSTIEKAGIQYVNERRRSQADVTRISDTLGASDDPESDVVFLTDPSSRDGYYFYIKLSEDPPSDARLILQVVRREGESPEKYEFTTTYRPGFAFGEYVIGLTGKQAGKAPWRPIAWRVSVIDGNGEILSARHSFLWGTPGDLGTK